jgi:hypothetical protein
MIFRPHVLMLGVTLATAGTFTTAVAANASCLSSDPARMIVKVAAYGGAAEGEAKNELQRFIHILNNKSDLWKEDIEPLFTDAPVLMQFALSVNLAEVTNGHETQPADAYKYWKDVPTTLQVLYGAIFPSQGGYIAHTSIHLGHLVRPNIPTIFNVTLPLEARELGTSIDGHSMIVYYALGLESRQLQCPTNVVSHFLTHAHETATTLLNGRSDDGQRALALRVKKEIEDILTALK